MAVAAAQQTRCRGSAAAPPASMRCWRQGRGTATGLAGTQHAGRTHLEGALPVAAAAAASRRRPTWPLRSAYDRGSCGHRGQRGSKDLGERGVSHSMQHCIRPTRRGSLTHPTCCPISRPPLPSRVDRTRRSSASEPPRCSESEWLPLPQLHSSSPSSVAARRARLRRARPCGGSPDGWVGGWSTEAAGLQAPSSCMHSREGRRQGRVRTLCAGGGTAVLAPPLRALLGAACGAGAAARPLGGAALPATLPAPALSEAPRPARAPGAATGAACATSSTGAW